MLQLVYPVLLHSFGLGLFFFLGYNNRIYLSACHPPFLIFEQLSCVCGSQIIFALLVIFHRKARAPAIEPSVKGDCEHENRPCVDNLWHSTEYMTREHNTEFDCVSLGKVKSTV